MGDATDKHRKDPGNSETNIYCNPTHTDKYLAFDSHHPICHKKIRNTRTDCLPSTCGCKANEQKYVPGVLKVDGYPKTFLRDCLKLVTSSRNILLGTRAR